MHNGNEIEFLTDLGTPPLEKFLNYIISMLELVKYLLMLITKEAIIYHDKSTSLYFVIRTFFLHPQMISRRTNQNHFNF